MTVGEWLSRQTLSEARWLLADTLGVGRGAVFTIEDLVLEPDVIGALDRRVQARLRGVPHAYVVGYQEFWSRKFLVGEGVLVPRPETELVVDEALALDAHKIRTVADWGAGSGCLGLTLALERPQWQVDLIECDAQAATWCELNQRLHDFHEKAHVLRMTVQDWVSAQVKVDAKVDLIVANPPYVPQDSEEIDRSVRDFEPPRALFSGAKGLDEIRSWLKAAALVLNPGGTLIMEIGYNQGDAVERLVRENGFIGALKIRQDYAGHDRIVVVQKAQRLEESHG